MRSLALLIFMLSIKAYALDLTAFRNDREGLSYVVTSKDMDKVATLSMRLDMGRIGANIKEIQLTDVSCAFNLNAELQKVAAKNSVARSDGAVFLKYLRTRSFIDDVVLKALLRVEEVQSQLPAYADDSIAGGTVGPDMKPLKDYFEKRAKGKCFEANFRDLFASYRKDNQSFDRKALKNKVKEAERYKVISQRVALELKAAIEAEADTWESTLADYVSTRNFLRAQHPVQAESSDFATMKVQNMKMSYRQKLYAYYTKFQILEMANVIKKLKDRLNSDRIEIHVFDEDRVIEVTTLTPMERFRFSIRYLRKEMRELSLHTFFAGRMPPYDDILAAAYEVGLVSVAELREVEKLQYIWNPKKSWWDKAQSWVRMASGVVSPLLGPLSFAPTLALTLIEAFSKDAPTDENLESLF